MYSVLSRPTLIISIVKRRFQNFWFGKCFRSEKKKLKFKSFNKIFQMFFFLRKRKLFTNFSKNWKQIFCYEKQSSKFCSKMTFWDNFNTRFDEVKNFKYFYFKTLISNILFQNADFKNFIPDAPTDLGDFSFFALFLIECKRQITCYVWRGGKRAVNL